MSVMTIIMAILSEYAIPLIGMAGAAIGYVVWRRKQRAEGRREAEAKQRERVDEAVQKRTEADSVVGGATDDELDRMLRPPDRR